jgi:hypothetical protein
MKSKLLSALCCVAVFLSGCTSTGQLQPVPPAQLVAQFCPGLQTFNSIIASTPGTSQKVLDDLKIVEPLVEVVCKDGSALDVSSLHALDKTALPLMLDIVSNAPIPGPQAEELRIAIGLAQSIVPQLLALPKP